MDNLLHLRITAMTLNKYNLLDPKQAAEAYRRLYGNKEADVQANEIQTEYDMQIVRWGERIYLIMPNWLNRFTAAVNLGIEPRQRILNSHDLTTRCFLRRGDENKAVVGKPELPEPWISYLKDSQIRAAVTKVELQNQQKTYTVDKGTVDGVKIGMFLVGENTKPDHDNLLFVISVEKSSATLKSTTISRAPAYQPGNILITKIVKDPR